MAQVLKGNADAGIGRLRALAKDDTTSQAGLALFGALVRTGRTDAALAAADDLRARMPGRPLPWMLRAQIEIEQRKFQQARHTFEQAAAKDASFFPAIKALAGLDLAEGKGTAGLQRLQSFTNRNPRDVDAAIAVVEMERRTGTEPVKLRPELEKLIQSFPGDVGPRLALASLLLEMKQAPAALGVAQSGVTAFPNDGRMFEMLGLTHQAVGESQQAQAALRRAISLQPNVAMLYWRLAAVQFAAKDYGSAQQSLESALQIAPRLLDAQVALSKVLVARRQHDGALKVAREVQAQRPDEAIGYLMQSDIFALKRDYTAAIGPLRTALERMPSAELAMRLHAMELRAGKPLDAQRVAADWSHSHPDDTDFSLYLATAAADSGRFDEAKTLYRQILAKSPDQAAANNNLALLLIRDKNPQALVLARKAQDLQPNDPAKMDTLARALEAAGQLPQALEWERKAVAAGFDTAANRLTLARLLVGTGAHREARAELDKLAALGSRFDRQAEVAVLLKQLST